MILKPGVRLHGIRPELLVAIMAAESIWAKHGVELVITSVIDGAHSRGSKHYVGCAVDFRIHGLASPHQTAADLQSALGADFDVLYENPGMTNAHIHCELDPKDPY